MSRPQKEDLENRALKVTLLSSEWRTSTDGELSTIIQELAIQLAKHSDVNVSVLLANCSEEDRSSAESHNVKLIEVDRIPGMEPLFWLLSPPINHIIDCVIGQGVHLGRAIAFIKRNPSYSHCKWIQVVCSAPEEDGVYKNFSEDEKKQETEIQLCKMADQVITIGSKLGEAYKHYLRPLKLEETVFDLTPGIFSEFLEVGQDLEGRRTFYILVIRSNNSCEDFNFKEYDIAAKAIAELKDESYKLKFFCPTGGNRDIVAEKLLHYGIRYNQFVFCNFDDSRKLLADLFCEVDLAIMPSRTEDFGIIALKALSAGLPILVSGNSGLGEALKKVPLGSHSVVDSEDPEAWAKEIKRVRQEKRGVQLSMSRVLLKKYSEKYSWEEPCKSLVIKMRNLVFGISKSMAKSRQSSVKRPSSGVLKFTAKKPSLHEEPMTLPSTSTKETTHYKECLQQKEGESVLIEGDVPMGGVMSQLRDVKMKSDTVQRLESKKDLLQDVEGITRFVVFRGEVTERGSVWNLQDAAAHLTFHEGAVPKPLLFTCSVLPPKPRCPPISSDELLVSNVIELSHDGPPDLELSGDDEGNVTVALLHSASDLKGYEVVIKQLVDPFDNEWKDLETWHASEKPEVSNWPQLVEATCTPSRCSSFAAIWRLKSFTFTRLTSVAPQFTCVVPDFPDLRVEVPLSSVPVDQDFTLTIKVQEFPNNEVKDFGIQCGPIIHISRSQNIVHMEPLTIRIPLALRESKHDFSELSNDVIKISCLDSEGKPWRDITGQLEGPVIVKDGNVEFKVKHFCRLCVCVFNKPVALLEDFFHRLFFRPMPQRIHFLACLYATTVPDAYALLLYCYPSFKNAEVIQKLSAYEIPYRGEGKSKEPVCVGDEIVVSPIALDFVEKSQRNEQVILRFLGNDISVNSDMPLIVRVDNRNVPTVKFYKGKELKKCLCEVPLLKTRLASVFPAAEGVDLRVLPEERPALGYNQELANFCEGQQPSTIGSGRPQSSGSTEVKQEEKSGSAAEKPKFDPIGEPGTSGLSSTSKTRKFKAKQGTPSVCELEGLALELGDVWKRLGRRLGITEPTLEAVNESNKDVCEKGYRMLKSWKKIHGPAATYRILGAALQHKLVNRRDLARKFCCK